MRNIYGNPTFVWWVGVVEDRQDPEKLGRCKVRVVGYHTSDIKILPKENLPWALPMTPITSASTSGVGVAPLGPVEGTWVVGWFLDGEEKQQPIMMGTLTGYPEISSTSGTNPNNPSANPTGPLNDPRLAAQKGFKDPNGVYPKKEYQGKQDTNKLATGDNSHAYFSVKSKNRKTAIKKSSTGTWSEPPAAFGARYPSNQVVETEAGHVIELDNTPNAERIHIYHKKGTYIEIDINGTMVRKVVGDNYEVCDRNGYVYVKGAYNLTVGGVTKILLENDVDIEVNGALSVTGHGSTLVQSAKTVQVVANAIDISSKSSIRLAAEGRVDIQGSDVYINAKSGMFAAKASGDLALQSGSGSTASLKGGLKAQIDAAMITTHGGAISVQMSKLPIYSTPAAVSVSTDAATSELTRPDSSGSIFLGDSLEEDSIKLSENRIKSKDVLDTVPLSRTAGFDNTIGSAVGYQVDTSEFKNYSNFPTSLKLSEYYTLGDVSTKCLATSFAVQDQNGMTKQEIVGNLKYLAVNVLDKVYEQYPDVVITSGFRTGSGSDHNKGFAVDLQFSSHSFSEYYEIARWIKDNTPYKQVLLEYATRSTGTISWIHVSAAPDGSKSAMALGTLVNHSTVTPGVQNALVNLL